VVEGINALGYGLTLGVHSRFDEKIASIVARARVGNVYVNRNIVGAVVGVQPFGGEGLSGTGPKAGGPLYLYRMLARAPEDAALRELRALEGEAAGPAPHGAMRLAEPRAREAFDALRAWDGAASIHALCARLAQLSPSGASVVLPGPTGERNTYALFGRESVLCLAPGERDALAQLAAVLAVGARAVWPAAMSPLHARLPEAVRARIALAADWSAPGVFFDAVLHHGGAAEREEIARRVARRDGPIAPLHGFAPGEAPLAVERLLVERVVSVNTAAAGGNASLMTVG
jgi:RHH-type proline utilization regulon transcriptional repressor/proline dehydrogenase/delta 1-pyrroline-5-carboxylate dehydrogenase